MQKHVIKVEISSCIMVVIPNEVILSDLVWFVCVTLHYCFLTSNTHQWMDHCQFVVQVF